MNNDPKTNVEQKPEVQTIELTSKAVKKKIIISKILFWGGLLFIIYGAYLAQDADDFEDDSNAGAGLLMIGVISLFSGFIMGVWQTFMQWWKHG